MSDDTGPEGWLADRERCKPAALSGARLRSIYDHLAALVPVVHNACPRRVRERHHAILAELSRLLP